MSEYSEMNYIPLDKAFLCVDCRAVGNSPLICPACASKAVQSLAGIVDRETSAKGIANAPQASVCPNCHESGLGCKEFGCWKWTPEEESVARKTRNVPAPRGNDGPKFR